MSDPAAIRRLDTLARLFSDHFEHAVADRTHLPARIWDEITPTERHALRAAMRALLQALDDDLDRNLAQMAAQIDELHRYTRAAGDWEERVG